MQKNELETATLGGGCFWCTQALFKRLKGVEYIISGYSGGEKENPTYEEVSSGTTDHAEVIQVKFDPKVISYEKILEVFFKLHDPTTLNRQGQDIGSQYRSVIFYHTENQREKAKKAKEKLEKEGVLKDKIVTEIVPFKNFYKAEDYHQNYYDSKPYAPYCQVVIDPKIQKLYQEFKNEVKE